jgi:hypothetical protein
VNRVLVPKRHQIKHLEFLLPWFGTRRSKVQILSPRPILKLQITNLMETCDLLVLYQGVGSSNLFAPTNLIPLTSVNYTPFGG